MFNRLHIDCFFSALINFRKQIHLISVATTPREIDDSGCVAKEITVSKRMKL